MNFNQQRRMLLEQQRREQQWSARQAQRQMDFQERMSSTAHQREVQDLINAGLNPVLSAGGQGASSANGAMAEQSSIIPELTQLVAAARSGGGHGGTKVIIHEGEEENEEEAPSAKLWGVSAGSDPAKVLPTKAKNIVDEALDAFGEAKQFVRELQRQYGELRFSMGLSQRAGARFSLSGTVEQAGHIAETLWRLSNNVGSNAGNILRHEARKMFNFRRNALQAKSARHQRAVLNQLEHEADYARYLVGK